MKVYDLIQELSKVDGNLEVIVDSFNGRFSKPICSVLYYNNFIHIKTFPIKPNKKIKLDTKHIYRCNYCNCAIDAHTLKCTNDVCVVKNPTM